MKFRQGLGRFLEARLVVSPIGFPDGGTTSISDWSRHSWCPLWRRARVRVWAVADGGRGSCPRAAGRVAASVYQVSSAYVQIARGRVS